MSVVSDVNHVKKRMVDLRERAERLAAEKNKAIEEIADLSVPGELKFKMLSVLSIVDDQISVYRGILREVKVLRRIQRDEAFEAWREMSPMHAELDEWEKDLGIFMGLLLKSLKRQRRAIKKRSGAYVWMMGHLLRWEAKADKAARFRSAFQDFYIQYETELALDKRYRKKLEDMLSQVRAKISLMDRASIVLNDPELRAVIERASSKGARDVKALRAEIDRVLEHKMGKRVVTAIFYRNAKWTVKKVTPFTMFSPVPGTNVAILTGVMLFSLGQAAKSAYVGRKSVKHPLPVMGEKQTA